jgi:hypothetical protein
MSDDFFIRLERQLEAAELRQLNRAPALRRLVSARRLLWCRSPPRRPSEWWSSYSRSWARLTRMTLTGALSRSAL